jgi:hypothetical protein
MKSWAFAGVLAATVLAAAAPSATAQKAEGRAELVQKLADCRKIADNTARLACYDSTAAAFDQAEAKGDIVVVDREQARKVRRQAFGFSLPSLSLFEKGETQEEIENVAAKIASVRQDATGKWILKLEDGAVWAQVDANELFKTPKPGMPVKIRRASMGSFLVSVDGTRAFRARRVE